MTDDIKRKPTIAELEAILDKPGKMTIELLPNGEIRAVDVEDDMNEEDLIRFRKLESIEVSKVNEENGWIGIAISDYYWMMDKLKKYMKTDQVKEK